MQGRDLYGDLDAWAAQYSHSPSLVEVTRTEQVMRAKGADPEPRGAAIQCKCGVGRLPEADTRRVQACALQPMKCTD